MLPSGMPKGLPEYPCAALTEKVIGAFYAVYHELGYGHVEALYRRAMAVELRYRHLDVRQEVPFEMIYRGASIGLYRADLVVDSRLIVEAKAGHLLDPTSKAQVLTYLKASRLEVGLILHFGPTPSVKRIVLSRATP